MRVHAYHQTKLIGEQFSSLVVHCAFPVSLHSCLFPVRLPPGTPLPPPDPQEFSSGDYVRVELDQDVLRLMQEGHGGWSSDMGDVSIGMMLSAEL